MQRCPRVATPCPMSTPAESLLHRLEQLGIDQRLVRLLAGAHPRRLRVPAHPALMPQRDVVDVDEHLLAPLTVPPLAKACPGTAADLEAEMLAGLVEAVRGWQDKGDRVAARLIWTAYRKARAFLSNELDYRSHTAPGLNAADPFSEGHPDLVLAEAVGAGVITAAEAELIGATRLEGIPLKALAAELQTPYDALQKRRRRAELDLLA
jgi:hypothetical protein